MDFSNPIALVRLCISFFPVFLKVFMCSGIVMNSSSTHSRMSQSRCLGIGVTGFEGDTVSIDFYGIFGWSVLCLFG